MPYLQLISYSGSFKVHLFFVSNHSINLLTGETPSAPIPTHHRPHARGAMPCAPSVWFKYIKTAVKSLLRRHQVNRSTKGLLLVYSSTLPSWQRQSISTNISLSLLKIQNIYLVVCFSPKLSLNQVPTDV